MGAPKKWNVTFTKYLKQKCRRNSYRDNFLSLRSSIGKASRYVRDNADEVCLAEWKPGKKSMKPAPSPQLSKECFAVI